MPIHQPSSPESPDVRAAMVVGHPGHELRIHHWVELHRPVVYCLTDGSGGAAESRIDSTRRLVGRLGSSEGSIFGRYPDKEMYQFLLEGRVDVFVLIARDVAKCMTSAGVNCVVGDAVEGFNPVHDVCRFIIDGAVKMMRRDGCSEVKNYEFLLDSLPVPASDPLSAAGWCLELDDEALERKLESSMDYPELREEVVKALDRYGKDSFKWECLRPADTEKVLSTFEQELPAYERYGEIRVTQGRYQGVIRYREHVLPVRRAIEEAAK